MTQQDLIELAKKVAGEHQLDPALVCAVCDVESSWNPTAVRLEQGFFERYVSQTVKHDDPQEAVNQATSWGLMQVMGATARDVGLQGPIEQLAKFPEVGLEMGCRKLKACLNYKVGNVVAALQMYNGGGDPHYADTVMRRMPAYKEKPN